jgi:hypothetical protein
MTCADHESRIVIQRNHIPVVDVELAGHLHAIDKLVLNSGYSGPGLQNIVDSREV